MQITKAHLDYWQQRRVPVPTWALGVAARARSVSLDSLINGNLSKHEMRLDAHNLLGILHLMRKRGANLREELQRLAIAPGTLINPKRRAGYAKRWLLRMERSS